MKEIGTYLKEKRLKNSVTLEEVSEDINIATGLLENIESGNIRAFKDIYVLKELVRDYAKYLGVEIDLVMDEFNDFIFEHTSKISLTDINEARKNMEEKQEKEKVISPYTKVKEKKPLTLKPILIATLIVFLIITSIFIFFAFYRREEVINKELQVERRSDYEYTN